MPPIFIPMTESRFYMWRTLFAIAHADNVVTTEERTMMNRVLAEQPFTEEQKGTLKKDMEEKHDIRAMFEQISDQQDRSDFFKFARSLVWIDGDFGADEQKIMTELGRIHMGMVDFDTFRGSKDIRLEEEAVSDMWASRPAGSEVRKQSALSRIIKALTGN